MAMEKGNISIHAQNIMPIIKKWLYSEKDIFVREIVSNASDAITKHQMLALSGEITKDEAYIIGIELDKPNGVIRITDNGIGMTADEVRKYITQVAFSGAEDFLKQYNNAEGENTGIIGHFGLGFYSAFMAASKVEIDTLSWCDGAEAVHWTSDDGMEYELSESSRTMRGTTITLHIAEDSAEYLEGVKLREVLEKYCAFMPVAIYFSEVGETELDDKGEPTSTPKAPKQINETFPLWLKTPKDVTEEEYRKFYSKTFHEYEEPLFWIHLNAEYPFNMKGILYFPKLKNEFSANEGQVKLFSSQVFVADNIKEVIPEFLLLLKGVIDCPELPLNVSRSFLQNDGYVQKLSAYITRKVADRLISEFNTNREAYQKYWNDIHPFVKYGCMKDNKFSDKVKDVVLYKSTKDEYFTQKEYADRNPDKQAKTVYYTDDPKRQAQNIELYTAEGIDVVMLDTMIDTNFISFLEYSGGGISFKRIDADLEDLTEKAPTDESARLRLEEMFRKAIGKSDLPVKLETLKSDSIPAFVMVDEQSRRFAEMSKRWGGGMEMPEKITLVLNEKSPLVKFLKHSDENDETLLIIRQVYDLAEMGRKPLEAEKMMEFITRSYKLLSLISNK